MKAIGIDIGTTTVCGIVLDMQTGEVAEVCTLDNDSGISGKPYERLQDAQRIWGLVQGMYHQFLQHFSDICCIGLTGQMHGIVYTDAQGCAVSPLYTWQDERGNETDQATGQTYVQQLSDRTGFAMASGFGLTTHYYQTIHHQIPEQAVHFCAIHDYIGMRLAGRREPLVTSSTAASFGCFDIKNSRFDTDAIKRAGMEESYLPQCQDGCILLGYTPQGIAVSAGVGDNQASVIGSVKDVQKSVLINVGTGAQVSVGADHWIDAKHVELRPVTGDAYLLVGSSLCGGRAYAAMEQFLRRTVMLMTGEDPGSLYQKMDEILAQREAAAKASGDAAGSGAAGGDSSLQFRTSFCGTREEPELTGCIGGLTLLNFTPEEFIYGVLAGMAQELTGFYEQMRGQGAARPQYLIGSGNGLRKNRHLQKIFEDAFGMRMQIPVHKEEASYGAALYAMTACGQCRTLREAQELIRYL